MLKRNDQPRAVILNYGPERLSEEQVKEAFAGQNKTFWYRALMQRLDDLRQANAISASQAASANNTLAMASGLAVYEALTGLMNDLVERAGGEPQSFQ